MGLQIINQNADYSTPGKNLGNINKSFQYVEKGVQNDKQNALKQFYQELKSADLLPYIYVAHVFLGGGADAYNLLNPQDGDVNNKLTFYNDGGHSASGWQLNNSRYADSHFFGKGGDFGLFVYNTGAEGATDAMLLGVQSSAGNIFLYRNYSSTTGFNSKDFSFDGLAASGSYNKSKTGFLGGVINNGQQYLYDDGQILAQRSSVGYEVEASNSSPFFIGANNSGDGNASIKSSAKIGLTMFTKGLTPAQVTVLSNIVATFAASVGW